MTPTKSSRRHADLKPAADKPRRLLALDAAGAACSAAVWAEGAVAAQRFEVMARGQSERLLPMIEEVMQEAGLNYAALDALAVTRGPGGFTGVRIGLATARGLALARGVPVIGVTNFEAVAASVMASELAGRTLVVAIETKRRDLYLQIFDGTRQAQAEPRLLPPEQLPDYLPEGPLLFAGDAAGRALSALSDARRALARATAGGHAEASAVAQIAAQRPVPPSGSPLPGPLYLRAPDVTVPAEASPGPRKKP